MVFIKKLETLPEYITLELKREDYKLAKDIMQNMINIIKESENSYDFTENRIRKLEYLVGQQGRLLSIILGE